MLSKEEELRLANCILTLRTEISGKEEFSFSLGDALWLAEKLEELNKEIKEATATLVEFKKDNNRTSTYSPKNDITDRWYPR